MPNHQIIDEIFAAFHQRGHQRYGEAVTQMEHMLQSATFAEQAGSKPRLIAAALLHDFGHLVHDLGEDVADQGIDASHEQLGADYLQQYFVPEVTEPGRLHVAAKRYLCAVDPTYLATLSAASVQSLALQGGLMSPTEVEEFAASPHFADAVQLRRFDDLGKEPTLPTPPLAHFRPYLEAGLK